MKLFYLGISGTTWVFGGYRDIAKNLSEQSQELPNLKKGDKVEIINSEYEQKFTNPPNRYSSTSLINKLEELGIGRPSTYVSIIQSITSVFYKFRFKLETENNSNGNDK